MKNEDRGMPRRVADEEGGRGTALLASVLVVGIGIAIAGILFSRFDPNPDFIASHSETSKITTPTGMLINRKIFCNYKRQ